MPSADAEYMREYRRRNPAVFDRHMRAGRARHRALALLREAHPDQYRRLLNAERAAAGLPPVGAVKPGPKPKDAAA